MPGNSYISTEPQDTVPLARSADWLWVFKLVIDEEAPGPLSLTWELQSLPNVVCTAITIREGAHPPVAQFRYVFSQELMPPEFPSRFHRVYGRVAKGPGVVSIDDRVVVVRQYDDGSYGYLFDGFVTSPQALVSQRDEGVTFTAHGTPIREWDFTLPGALWGPENFKDSQNWKDRDGGGKVNPFYFTEEPARFNPLGRPNSAFTSTDPLNPDRLTWSGLHYFKDTEFRLFATVTDNDRYAANPYLETPLSSQHWTLATAAQYVVGMGIEWPFGFNWRQDVLRPPWQAGGDVATPYVSVYDLNAWGDLLKAVVPKDESKPVNLSDPSTYTTEDIRCPDIEVTGDAWPHALEKLLAPFGFHFRFDLRVDQSHSTTQGLPEWYLTVYRVDDPHNRTKMYLQNRDDVILNPGLTNVGGMQVGHEAVGVANEFEVDTQLVQYEATFILAPAFPIDPTDGDDDHKAQWIGEHVDPTKRDYYRKFVFGEGGDPVWGKKQDGSYGLVEADDRLIYQLFNLLFDPKKPGDPPDPRWDQHATRRRRPFGHLVTKMPDGRPYNARLALSNANMGDGFGKYDGTVPGLWNGKGIWHNVTNTDWHLLDDCIGVRISTKDPNDWPAGPPKEGVPYPFYQDSTGKINIVEALTGKGDWVVEGKPLGALIFALTCSVFSDWDLDVLAPYRKVSPTRFRIRRKVDHRDRHKRQVVTRFSQIAVELAPGLADPDVQWSNKRDDTAVAQYQADAYRRAHECGSHAGRVEMRRLSTAYNVGQTVIGVIGRNVDLQINSGAPAGETPLWPRIQSITWNLEPEQLTLINLTDERADPPSKRINLQLRQQVVRHRV